ncbi:hypothetical protein CK203_009059 [Vitis vinifera]|uniref:Uncharacterized protein n=1 Tax=Vitis vinifera TaxID=29760 RepID=A0A438K2P8_VITVI|nr:hypothetical protein CK203_009059 [Vitis vinifera]
MADKTIGGVCPDTLSERLLQERLNQESILVKIARPSIWKLRGSSWTRSLNIGVVYGKIVDSVTDEDSHTFQSRSSGKEEEDHSEWRHAIERRQLAREQQLQTLLQETERLREETRCYASRLHRRTSRRQHSRGPDGNSRSEPESIYLGTARAIPETSNVRPHEPHYSHAPSPCGGKLKLYSFFSKKTSDKGPSCQTQCARD